MAFNVLYHTHQILFDEIIQVLSSKNALKNTLSLDGGRTFGAIILGLPCINFDMDIICRIMI